VIYYHFINAAIVAPDAYDIITLPADKTLMADQRNNLASIAKILQYAASKKGVSLFFQMFKPNTIIMVPLFNQFNKCLSCFAMFN
jgi:hypothetical protein